MYKISNELTLLKDKEIMKYCKDNLVLSNPEYEKKMKLNLWLGDTPKKLHLYKEIGDSVVIPFGCIKSVWKHIKNKVTEVEFNELPISINGNVSLYDYQDEAVNKAYVSKNGVLVSPAGSGKTQMGIGLINLVSQKTLWLTHTKELLNQSRDRLKQYLECDIGEITAGKVKIGDVTFATVQTMSKLDKSIYENEFSMVIVDEAHRLCSSPTKLGMFGKVVNSIKARYKIGLTATAWRSDGMIKSLYAYLGDIFHEVDKKEVESKTVKAVIKPVSTDFNIDYNSDAFNTDGTINFTAFTNILCRDEERCKLIADYIIKHKNESCLVLSSRIEQLKRIKELVGEGVLVHGKMTSKKDKALREQYIDDMRSGKGNILYASYNLAKEGLDIPRLNNLFFASPQKDYAVIVQSVGRIERMFEGKKEPVVYDFVDRNGLTYNMYKSRKSIYRKNNNRVIEE